MMKDRIYSSALILGVLICALLIRYFVPIVFDVFWLAIVIVSIYEVTRVFKRRGNTAFEWIPYTYAVAFLALVLIPIFLDLAFYQMIILQLTLLIAVSIILLILPFCFRKKIVYDEQKFGSAREYLMNKSITTLNIIIYPALLLGLMYMLNHICSLGVVGSDATDEVFGLFAILMVFVVSMMTDTFAMLGGMLFKGKKLCPLISPNKTISGFITGLVMGTVSSLIMYAIFNSFDSFNLVFESANVEIWHFAIFGFVGALATSLGDLFASFLKRRAFVKDFGRVFPGHGGFMDRLNGICFNLLVMILFFVICF